MFHRNKFTSKSNAQVVLELLDGTKSSAEWCHEPGTVPSVLADWKAVFLLRSHAPPKP